MAYQSPSSKKKKGSALRGLFADPAPKGALLTPKERKARDEKLRRLQARVMRRLQLPKGKVSEREMEQMNRLLGPKPRK